MIVAIPFSHTATITHEGKAGPLSNAQLAAKWFDWCAKLGGVGGAELLVLAPTGTALPESTKAWKKVTYIRDRSDVKGWPYGPNSAFTQIAWYMFYRKENQEPWLFCEPDCVPLKPDWLARLEEEYSKCGKPFMGGVVAGRPDAPEHMSGNAIYPADAIRLAPSLVSEKRMNLAWDVRSAHEVVPQAHLTELICDRFRRPAFTTVAEIREQIPETAVLFHSDKYGAIINLFTGEMPVIEPAAAAPPVKEVVRSYSMSELVELVEANVKTETARTVFMDHLRSKHFHQKNFGAVLKESALAQQ